MRTNYRVNSGVRFQMLSQDQLEEMFNGVLYVLETIGLDVHHDEAREILGDAEKRQQYDRGECAEPASDINGQRQKACSWSHPGVGKG